MESAVARRDKGEERDIAVRRIDTLLALARLEALAKRGDLADRYAHLSLQVAQKYQTGLLRRQKAQVCRACATFLVPGRSARTRLAAGNVVTTCLRCGNIVRRPLHAKAGATSRGAEAAKPPTGPTRGPGRGSPSRRGSASRRA